MVQLSDRVTLFQVNAADMFHFVALPAHIFILDCCASSGDKHKVSLRLTVRSIFALIFSFSAKQKG